MDYSYQAKAAEKVLENALSGNYLASILAACPGAGKTTISHLIINKYIEKFPNARIIVLTEGQTTLSNQYLDELNSPNVEIKFTYGKLGSNSQVEVGIPQGIGNRTKETVDLLVIDEAHNYYLAPMVQDIVKTLNPKHQVLMTGSPSKYNKHNSEQLVNWENPQKEYAIYYIAAEELINRGVFSSVDLDVAKVQNKKDAVEVVKKTIEHALASGYNMDKIMIATPTIAFAKKVTKAMEEKGRKVSLSTSENDKEDLEIKRFKNNETDVLVVVGRGILGFNDKLVTSLFDFRSSTDVDASYQLFARVLRTHPDNVRKAYVRVGDEKNFQDQVLRIHQIKALMEREVFVGFDGGNLSVGY